MDHIDCKYGLGGAEGSTASVKLKNGLIVFIGAFAILIGSSIIFSVSGGNNW